jgi:hypothetical protein
MQVDADLSQVRQIIEESYKVLLITKEGAQGDLITAQHILYEGLNEKGKKVFLSPSDQDHPGVPERSVTLRFGYDGQKIERLQYRIRDDEVELTFTPFTGRLNQDSFSITYPSFDVDLVIALGLQNKDQIPQEVHSYALDFDTVKSINLDNQGDNNQWAKLNAVMTDIPVYSLLAIHVLEQLGMPVRDYWKQMVLVETKEELPQVGSSSPRLLRMVADLIERRNS